jgi:excisionase family DNA binding protein
MADKATWHGTGPRLITITEAAEILGVREQAVMDWIAAGKLKAVTLPGGERRLRIADEQRLDDGASDSTYSVRSAFYALDFWPEDRDEHARATWGEELARKRREKRLEDVDPGSIDVAALARELATRLSDALPPRWIATGTEGIISVLDADGGVVSSVDVALILGDECDTAEDRVLGRQCARWIPSRLILPRRRLSHGRIRQARTTSG